MTVAERVQLAHEQNTEFEMIASDAIEIAGRWIWKCVIRVRGRQFIGDAEIKLDAAKGTPDGTNPFECAETSALGRALGFAGLGAVEGIASADEMYRALAGQNSGAEAQREQASSATAAQAEPGHITQQQLQSIRKLCSHLGKAEPERLGQTSYTDAKKLISQLSTEYRERAAQKK